MPLTILLLKKTETVRTTLISHRNNDKLHILNLEHRQNVKEQILWIFSPFDVSFYFKNLTMNPCCSSLSGSSLTEIGKCTASSKGVISLIVSTLEGATFL